MACYSHDLWLMKKQDKVKKLTLKKLTVATLTHVAGGAPESPVRTARVGCREAQD
jgi:hypothetical protein